MVIASTQCVPRNKTVVLTQQNRNKINFQAYDFGRPIHFVYEYLNLGLSFTRSLQICSPLQFLARFVPSSQVQCSTAPTQVTYVWECHISLHSLPHELGSLHVLTFLAPFFHENHAGGTGCLGPNHLTIQDWVKTSLEQKIRLLFCHHS